MHIESIKRRQHREGHKLCTVYIYIYIVNNNRRIFETARRNRKTGFKKGRFYHFQIVRFSFVTSDRLLFYFILYYIVEYRAHIFWVDTLIHTRTSHPFGDCSASVEDIHKIRTQ